MTMLFLSGKRKFYRSSLIRTTLKWKSPQQGWEGLGVRASGLYSLFHPTLPGRVYLIVNNREMEAITLINPLVGAMGPIERGFLLTGTVTAL